MMSGMKRGKENYKKTSEDSTDNQKEDTDEESQIYNAPERMDTKFASTQDKSNQQNDGVSSYY
jgi:hypothetical protein